GLLDGRRATTHWARAAEFARAYPKVRVEPDRIFIRDGAVWTSAGITAGIDLALALVADDLGEPAAKRAAQHLVVYHRRPGGQSQFSALIEADRAGSRFSPVLSWARERLGERLPVERLAERAAMSPRHFARDRHDPGQGDRAPAPGSGARAGRKRRRADRGGGRAHRLRRPRAHAPRLSARLRPAAPGAAPRRPGQCCSLKEPTGAAARIARRAAPAESPPESSSGRRQPTTFPRRPTRGSPARGRRDPSGGNRRAA